MSDIFVLVEEVCDVLEYTHIKLTDIAFFALSNTELNLYLRVSADDKTFFTFRNKKVIEEFIQWHAKQALNGKIDLFVLEKEKQ